MPPQIQRIFFEKEKLILPLHLGLVVPLPVHHALGRARQAADDAFFSLKQLEHLWLDRYRRLCSVQDEAHLFLHIDSINRLFDWKVDHDLEDPTLAPAAKIPQVLLHFHVDEKAYAEYVEEFNETKNAYITGLFNEWQIKKYEMDIVLHSCKLREMDLKAWMEWWKYFLKEMRLWEMRVDQLVLPSYEHNAVSRPLALNQEAAN
jgi:hypothetical protein